MIISSLSISVDGEAYSNWNSWYGNSLRANANKICRLTKLSVLFTAIPCVGFDIFMRYSGRRKHELQDLLESGEQTGNGNRRGNRFIYTWLRLKRGQPVQRKIGTTLLSFCELDADIGNSSVDIYRVIWNDCRGFNNLSYTIHFR